MTRQLFVTTALPYANGPFHIGHMMEYIQADIWVRFQRMCGNEVRFVCADDAHGAAIMISAQKAGMTPQAFVAQREVDGLREFVVLRSVGRVPLVEGDLEAVEIAGAPGRDLRDEGLRRHAGLLG